MEEKLSAWAKEEEIDDIPCFPSFFHREGNEISAHGRIDRIH